MVFAAACGEPALDESSTHESLGEVSEAVVGGTAIHGPSLSPTGAVGLLKRADGGACTGTLAERADKVLTAAHCTCGVPSTTTWTFILPSQANVPANEIGLPPNCFSPGDPNNPDNRAVSAACFVGTAAVNPQFACDGALDDDSGSDLAVITLQSGLGATTTNAVPASLATPQKVYLGQSYSKFQGGNGQAFFAGFGAFHEAPGGCSDNDIPRTSEFVRRVLGRTLASSAQPELFLRYEDDPCDSLIEGFCHDRPIWYSFPGSQIHTGRGDSGGPLFATRDGVTQIVGVLYGRRCANPLVAGDADAALFAMTADPQTDWRQSRLGENRVWLADNLLIPPEMNATQVLTEPALFATQSIKINDRATVVPDANAIARARIATVTGNTVIEIRNDVQTMDVAAGGEVQLFDRVRIAGDLAASKLTVVQGQQTVTGAIRSDTVVRVANLIGNLTLMPSTSNLHISIEPGGNGAPGPGTYGNVSLKSRTKLFLEAGVYVFKNFTAEPDAIVEFITPGAPTHIVVNGTFTWRGSIGGAGAGADSILWAVRDNAIIGAPLLGTILSPNGAVVVDSVTDFPAIIGAIYARTIEVHQGKQIRHRPFVTSWGPVLSP